jgi:outer membrane lipoprotein carrier protein
MKLLIVALISAISIFANKLNFQSFQSDFIQNIKNPSGKVITYEGSIVAYNNNFIWRYTQPIQKEVYILDGNVIINEPELEQIIYTTTNTQLNLNNLLKDAQQIDKNNYFTFLNDTKYSFLVKDEILMSLSYLDGVDNKVNIIFKNQIKNGKIDSKIFLFDPNPNFDIIKQ